MAQPKKKSKSKQPKQVKPKTTVKVTTVKDEPEVKAQQANKAEEKSRKLKIPKLPDNKAGRAAKKLRPRSPFKGYFINSWRELKNVKWPSRKEAWKLTFAVIIFSVVFAAFLTALDFAFERLAKVIFLH